MTLRIFVPVAGAAGKAAQGASAGSKVVAGMKAGAKTGAGLGALSGAGHDEGGVIDRLDGAALGAVTGGISGALLGGAGVLLARGASKARIWARALSKQGRINNGFKALAEERKRRGLPVAGSADDTSTLSRLEVNGKEYYGVNSGNQVPKTQITLDRVNAQTKTHAEAEVIQKALNDGSKRQGGKAELWVDRDPCKACGERGGLRSLARNLGVDELIVHGPSGSKTYTPTK